MRTYTAEEIVQIVPKELATLRKDFPGVAWAEKLAPMLDQLCEIAAAAPNHDAARLADLERRVSQLIQSDRKLKGLAPTLWMIASLKTVEIKARETQPDDAANGETSFTQLSISSIRRSAARRSR